MKYLYLSLCFVLLLSTTQGQQKSNFYYFGNTKVTLKESTEKVYVRLKKDSTETKKKTIQNEYKLPDEAFKKLQADNFLVINLKSLDVNDRIKIASDLSKSVDVEISRPVFIAPGGKDVVIDEGFYVKLKQGTSYQQLKDLAAQNNCILNEKSYKYDNKVYLLKAGSSNKFDGLKMANVFYESGLFIYSEPDFRVLNILHSAPAESIFKNGLIQPAEHNYKLNGGLTSPPNDPLFEYQWALKNTGTAIQYNGTVGADINVLEAWDITMGSPLIKIAVIDEGVDRAHPDLINNIAPIGFGFGESNANTGNILYPTASHGTSCAGIIAAQANNIIGVAGIAPNCKIIPVNINDGNPEVWATDAHIAESIDWSWNDGGADILSNSYGGGLASSIIKDAIHRAVTLGRGGKGAIVVFSAGNDNGGVAFPGVYSDGIAVGAMSMCNQRTSPTSCDGETWWGTNYGSGLDISAPGTKIATTRISGTGVSPNLDYNLTFNGTSAAAPVVAGVAALVLSANTNLTQIQAREILERTAKKVGTYSYGRIQIQPNGSWSTELGHGMVNAKDAVISAQNPTFCIVETSASGALQVCNSGTVSLQITNYNAANTYTWRKDGIAVGSGISFNANQTGNYDVILNSSNSCTDTSYLYQVIVSPQEGQLIANAGRDTTLFIGAKTFLGAGPSGTGGTPIINPTRGFVNDILNDRLLRFDQSQPTNFQIVKSGFNNDIANGKQYVGAATTPYGLFMIDGITGMLVKIDTATGNSYNVGLTSINTFNGMAYDPTTNKIFAVSKSGSSNNKLYEINHLTGAATLITELPGTSGNTYIISLAVDNSGQLFGLLILPYNNAALIKIDKFSGTSTALSDLGYKAYYNQGGDVDPVTNELYLVIPRTYNYDDGIFPDRTPVLWKMNKTTGAATMIGSVGEPYNELDAVAFANKEYKYQWSPSTNLSNPNDANPQFTGTTAGTFVYTLTVTDLCGNTATKVVKIRVRSNYTCPPSNIIYVNHNATGLNNGSSWADAYTNLQDALGLVCENVTQVWVAKGSYFPDLGGGYNLGDRKANFTLQKNLAIYGGFDGTETAISERNISANPTILSGDIGTVNDNSDNSYHVVIGAGDVGTATINDFIIEGGNSNATEGQIVNGFTMVGDNGGGMYNNNASPRLTNIIVRGNNSAWNGGGIFNESSSPVLTNVNVSGNNAVWGGGVYNNNSSFPVLTNVTISGNASHGLINVNSSPKIRNTIIYGNTYGLSDFDENSISDISYSLVQGLTNETNGNISGNKNPFFVAPLAPGLSSGGDYRLISYLSPAFNTASNEFYSPTSTPNISDIITDLSGGARINNGLMDIGAYEISSFAPVIPTGGIAYVTTTGNGDFSGSSWANATSDLQLAINSDNVQQVWVAGGTYKPKNRSDNMSDANPNDRNNAFVLKNNVKVYGGFAGTETALTQRDSTRLTNNTILSGDLGAIGNSDNSYHVVISIGNVGTAELNGFSIQDGNANGGTNIIVLSESVNSDIGGGVILRYSSPKLSNISVLNNSANYYGGGMYINLSSPVLTNVAISANQANYGGGIYNESSSPVLNNVIISGNNAATAGGGISSYGSSSVLTNVTIAGNNATVGGGIRNNMSSPKIRNSIISGNSSGILNYDVNSVPEISFSLVQELTDETNGNISGSKNPLFIAPLAPGLNAGGDYRLSSNASPAYNAGDNAFYNIGSTPDLSSLISDFDGEARVQNGVIDLGAYEGAPFTPINPTGGIAYVTVNGNGNFSGSSWANATNDLQQAINGTSVQQVWVAGGTYKPKYRADNMSDANPNDRDNAFVLKNNVKVYGGFAGNETSLTQRDSTRLTNNTILSGDLGGNGNADNAHHVVISVGGLGTAELNGFSISGGNANLSGTIIVLTKSIYRTFGGGLYISSSSPTLTNLTVSNNNAYYGGGFEIISSSSPILTNLIVDGNTSSSWGGGIDLDESSPILTNVVVSGNTAGNGGGIYIGSSTTVLTNVAINGNTAGNGGGIYNSSSTPSLTNVTISGNTSPNGAEWWNQQGTPIIRNSIIYGNGIAGELYNNQNSLLQNHTSTANGNIYYTGNVSALFADAPNGNYTLASGSPAINSGNNSHLVNLDAYTKDLAGNSRVFNFAGGGIIDMGAYESSAYLTTVITSQPLTTQALCVGTSTENLEVTATGDGLTYQWYSDNDASGYDGFAITNANSSLFAPPSSVSGVYYYYVKITGLGGEATSNYATVNLNALPSVPTMTPTSVAIFEGNSTTLNAVSGISAITWSPATGLSSTTGNTVTANPAATSTYTATATNTEGCTSSNTVTVNVFADLIVDASISGPTNACAHMSNASQLAIYSITAQGASSYVWTIPAGATNVTGQGTNTISFNYPMSFTSGIVSVLVSPMSTELPGITRILAIGRTVPTAPIVSGIKNVCNYVGTGIELTYTAAPDANVSSYVWTIPPTATLVSGQGTNTINIKLSPGFIASANKQIRVKSVSACGTSAMTIFFMAAQLPQAVAQINGPTEVCSYVGTTNELTYNISNVTSASSYIWTVPTGATIIGNTSGTSIKIIYDNTFMGGSISVRAVNSCGTSNARSLDVKRTTPSMPGPISGPANICTLTPSTINPSGLNGVYSVARHEGLTYLWNVPDGIIIESHSSTTTEDIITVSFNSNYAGGSIGVSSTNDCGTSPERILNLSQLTPGAVGGILQLSAGDCQDRTYVYAVANMPTNATSLDWIVPVEATIISGVGTTAIHVLFPNEAISGTISASGNNGCGSSSVARTFAVKLPACNPEALQVKGDVKVEPAIEITSEQLDIKVYPNPSITSFRLRAIGSNFNELIQVRILDNLGREFKRLQMKSGETICFGSELKSGSYFVEITQGKLKVVKKVLKF